MQRRIETILLTVFFLISGVSTTFLDFWQVVVNFCKKIILLMIILKAVADQMGTQAF